ncbi:MAG TPA: hypothetical protein VNA20_15360 [Frankiaceae bacterium]|nr:hypothetical protein [Frankiaceae bacterium]
MNETEVRLRDALRDATAGPEVPPYLLARAAAGARRSRRRRVVAGGAVGAAAVAVGVTVPVQRPARDMRQVAPVATTAAATTPAAIADLRVTVRHTACRESTPGAGIVCHRTELTLLYAGESRGPGAVEDGHPAGDDHAVAVPHDVVVRFTDGSTQRADLVKVGDREWVADFDVPAGAEVATLRVRDEQADAYLSVTKTTRD